MEKLFKKHKKRTFIGADSSHKNGASESATKKIVTMDRIMLMHDTLKLTQDKFYTDIWPTKINYDVWI